MGLRELAVDREEMLKMPGPDAGCHAMEEEAEKKKKFLLRLGLSIQKRHHHINSTEPKYLFR